MEKMERLLALWLSTGDFKNNERQRLKGDYAALRAEFGMDPRGETIRSLEYRMKKVMDVCDGILIPDDELFDEVFDDQEDRPCCIYYRGNINILRKRSITVAGTRTPTEYGRFVTEKITEEICSNGYSIVSGGARGIDSISHRTALKCDGKTICVLGGGFNHIYPPENRELFDEIVRRGGLLISEYHPDMKPRKYFFPERNRIMAYLSEITVITEAAQDSGSLHTAALASQYGRMVLTVPHAITSHAGEGCNFLISAGVDILTSPSDINYYLRGESLSCSPALG